MCRFNTNTAIETESASRKISSPKERLDWVGSSVAERVPVKHLRAGSSPAQPSFEAQASNFNPLLELGCSSVEVEKCLAGVMDA